MKQELEQIEYNDVLVGMNSAFEQYGVREVMKDFRNSYPKMFEEMVVQLARLTPTTRVASLLRPPDVGTM
jgi:hypothetical protein